MKKSNLIFALTLIVVTFSLWAQKPGDMVGTWAGTATLDGESEPNILTLVLTMEEGKLAGHMTDQFDSMYQVAIEKTSIEKGTFTFSVQVDLGGGTTAVNFKMDVSGESMKGTFEIPEVGMYGAWEATKQK